MIGPRIFIFEEHPACELVPACWARPSIGEPGFEATMADDVFARETEARRVAMTVVGGFVVLAADGAVLCRVEVKWVDRGYGQQEPLRFAMYFARVN